MKKKINRDLAFLFVLSLILSITFVIGIPLTCITAGKNNILMAMGIVMIFLGFYGTPVAWVIYADRRHIKHCVDSIIDDNLLTVQELSNQFPTSEETVISWIRSAISKKYLKGYIFNGKELILSNKKNTN